MALFLLASGLLYVDYKKFLFAERTPWLAHRLILSLVCLESWENPWNMTQVSLSLARSLTHSLSHTHTHTHTGSLSRSRACARSLSRSLAVSG